MRTDDHLAAATGAVVTVIAAADGIFDATAPRAVRATPTALPWLPMAPAPAARTRRSCCQSLAS